MGSGPRVVVVAKKTAYTRFVEERQEARVLALLERSDPSVRRWKPAHRDHQKALQRVLEVLDDEGADTTVLCGPQEEIDARGVALLVCVGGDGTLLSASHHLGEVPILGVNSAPNHSVGFFCAARLGSIRELLPQALSGTLSGVRLHRMAVSIDNERVANRVLNEALFCHGNPAATSRYILRYAGQREEQRSSGVWIGTAAGSTGAIRSAGGKVLPLQSDALQLVVREPYLGDKKPYSMEHEIVRSGKSVTVQNKMHDAWLFLDGPFKRIPVQLGQKIRFQASGEPLLVLGLDPKRRRVR